MNQHLPPSNLREISVNAPVEKFIVFRGSREPWIDGDLFDRYSVIAEIASEQSNLNKIIAFDLGNGTCRDATAEIVGTVVHRWAQDGKLLTKKQRDWVAEFMGEIVANAFRLDEVA